MFRNQKGFTYPITLCFLLLFSSLLLLHTEQILTEKRMLIESEAILKQDYYLNCTLKEIKHILASNQPSSTTGSVIFYDGQVNYIIEQKSPSIWYIQVNIKTGINNGKPTDFRGVAHYDAQIDRIVKWMEVN